MYEIARDIPDVEEFLAFSPKELGAKLLFLARTRFGAKEFSPDNLRLELWPQSHVPSQQTRYPGERRAESELALSEAWSWLEGNGWVVPYTNAGPGWKRLSRQAQRVVGVSEILQDAGNRIGSKQTEIVGRMKESGPMTLSQTLELAIYRFVEGVGKGQRRTASLPSLSALVPGATDRDVADSLIRLGDRFFVYIDKWDANNNRFITYAELDDKDSFFFGAPYGDPRIRITAEGRPHFEELEQLAAREQRSHSADVDTSTARTNRPAALRRIVSSLKAQLEEVRQISDDAVLSGASASPVIAIFKEAGELLPGLIPEFHFYASPTAFRPQIAHVLSIVEDAVANEAYGTPVTRPASDKHGVFKTTFGAYIVLRPLGEGGTGAVFEVRDEDGSHYALKLLKSSASSKERIKRFKNEIWFCSKNHHPNIISVLDWGFVELDGQAIPFYVMPLFKSTLRNLMKRGLEQGLVPHLFENILNGIEAAHLQRVWHRDLKPENILYDPDADSIVLADFGIAHFAEPLLQTMVETSPGDRLANFAYAAPEQCRRGQVDERADVYALGMILNEMFTGELLRGTGHKLIGSVAPEYAYLDAAVDSMVRQSPDDRPRTIAEIRKAVCQPPDL